MLPPAKLLALSNRIYSLLLYLYPASFREAFGYEMAQVFRDDMRDTLQESGLLPVVGLWFRAFFDLLKTAVTEHILEVLHMPIEKLTRWSGPATAVGGLLYAAGVASIIYGPVAFTISLLVTVPLLGLGLFGLYKSLPTTSNRLNMFTFMVTVIGLLVSNLSALLIVWLDKPESNWVTVMMFCASLWIMGFAGMAIITMAKQTLGRWSFAPLLATVALMGMGSLYGRDPSSPIGRTLLAAYAASWILLGVALWQAHRQSPAPTLFA